jgi:ABC-type transport system substrate-binding protein
MAYPTGGDAPCGQAEAPDASHAAYTGNLKRIRARDAATVVFELCAPDVAFLSKIASPAFGINDAGWLQSHIDPGASGDQAIVTEVNGTGPYRLEGWNHGVEVSLARNDAYWGEKTANDRVIVRWRDDPAQRVAELQGGTVDGIDDVDPSGVATVVDDVSLRLELRPGLNVFYMGFTNTFAPFDNEKVRRAIAMGIDRQRIVERFFPPGSEVATHYAPCTIPHGCAGDPWDSYDPFLAKELLAAAGYPNGFDTTIQYRATAHPYLPDPAGVAQELRTQLLDNLGIRAELVVEPDDTFLDDVDAGKLDGIHLLGQNGSYPDVSAFLDPRFGSGASDEFGRKFTDIENALASGDAGATDAEREVAYLNANDAIRSHVPMIPIARTGSAAAYRADVDGASASALRQERFALMTPGDRRQFVWLTTAEPAGLYCADETEPIATLVCSQLVESLYEYDPTGASAVPSLAERCAPNPELTVWTCTLRPGVLFHDGSRLDANDVVLSFAVQWDAEHPRHRGHEGAFRQFAGWFGGLLNAPSGSS